mgnify:CR=1 FL=1
MILTAPLEFIGRNTLSFLAAIGRVTLFAIDILRQLFLPPFYLREFALSLLQIGWLSLPVVGLIINRVSARSWAWSHCGHMPLGGMPP